MQGFFKRLIVMVSLVFAVGLLLQTSPVVAAPDIGLGASGTATVIGGKAGYEVAGVTQNTLSERIGKIIKSALSLIGTIFFVLTFYAGFLWMTASGNEEQVAKAKSILRMGIIGMVITLSSFSITYFVIRITEQSANITDCDGQDCER